jgi:hypothetical protein
MSKSIGNVVDPQKVIDNLGADVLRLWVASADYRNEISVSNEILKRSADAYRRIRNPVRFLLGNRPGVEPALPLPAPERMLSTSTAIMMVRSAFPSSARAASADDVDTATGPPGAGVFCATAARPDGMYSAAATVLALPPSLIEKSFAWRSAIGRPSLSRTVASMRMRSTPDLNVV